MAIFGKKLPVETPTQEEADALKVLLETLDPTEVRVLCLRLGIETEKKTLKEVGEFLGVTGTRIRQIEAKGLRKLRHPLRSRHLRKYLEEARQ